MITTGSTPFKIIPTDIVFTPNKLFYINWDVENVSEYSVLRNYLR
jgi:hypothetical protein